MKLSERSSERGACKAETMSHGQHVNAAHKCGEQLLFSPETTLSGGNKWNEWSHKSKHKNCFDFLLHLQKQSFKGRFRSLKALLLFWSSCRIWLMICPQSWVGISRASFWVCWCWRPCMMPTSWRTQWRFPFTLFLVVLWIQSNKNVILLLSEPRTRTRFHLSLK